MKAPQWDRWEHDPAHQACQQWVTAWRSQNPDADLPRVGFTIHIGNEARELASGMSKVELLRLFASAGHDGQCVCGMDWTEAAGVELRAVGG